jgi:hypothetical protein
VTLAAYTDAAVRAMSDKGNHLAHAELIKRGLAGDPDKIKEADKTRRRSMAIGWERAWR